MKAKVNELVILGLIVGLAWVFHLGNLTGLPSQRHAWAESDRYALSLGFVENGLQFFEPQTFIYNHQFPHNWEVPGRTTITAVDFPLHDYLPAVLMKVFGSTSPWIFRLYILLYSFIGLFFLYRLSFAVTKDSIKSALVVAFAATSPVFVYYQAGFLPTIPSLANAIIGMYFYYLFLGGHQKRDFRIGLFFVTLAALSRTTFAIPLIAMLGVEFIRLLRGETKFSSLLLPVSGSILSILAYWLYNGYLREEYGSMFLNYPLPATSIEQAKEIIVYVYDTWALEYLTVYHYVIVFAAGVAAAVYSLFTRNFNTNQATGYLGILWSAYVFGCLLFALLMLRQFPAHEYYFLDTFLFPLLLFLLVVLSLLPVIELKAYQVISAIVVAVFSVMMTLDTIALHDNVQEAHYLDRTKHTIRNYQGAAEWLDSLRVPRSAKMLVMNPAAPNLPFILMQRKGYAVMRPTAEIVEKSLGWDYQFIVLEKQYFVEEVYNAYPQILSKLDKIADNGRLAVCRFTENNEQSLLDFMGVKDTGPVLKEFVDFENDPDPSWQNFHPVADQAYRGEYSGHVTSDMTYGLTYRSKNLPELRTASRTLAFSSYFLTSREANCEIVVSIDGGGENLYYQSYSIKNLVKQKGEWKEASLVFSLPRIQRDTYELAIYVWNRGKSDLYYDNVEFSLY
ncbi:ArnT family glycosyltransferase [Lewinella sp. IMCC34191]|uniref:ArnT family glycosyltransferase n=1 Tax=Lewinella sp. IMCC34191 TaxID=2259172 RepID=UPI000E220980|nr:glycosyltransferase family 39 protein [Lewinella sp. IMCC34191]